MDSAASLGFDPKSLSVLRFASYLLPESEYVSRLTNFPATNCMEPYGTRGDFFMSLALYENGQFTGKVHTPHCTDKGHLELNFQEISALAGPSTSKLLITDFYHSSNVPVELYIAHIHKKTGSYVAYPAGAFIGDELYQHAHDTQLENTLFWPGMVSNDRMEMSIFVLNPYKLSFSYQFSLFLGNSPRMQTEVFKVKPHCVAIHKLGDIFADAMDLVKTNNGRCSVCIAAQYKVVAYMMIRDRVHNVFTTIDHLHTYALV